ncbi:hypothetical protein [Elizabethkingia miricola]|uniref:hypothetical protein n=1 Tax=Elizabethkingia miricola TaxID=172045 RepID=UPI00389121D2
MNIPAYGWVRSKGMATDGTKEWLLFNRSAMNIPAYGWVRSKGTATPGITEPTANQLQQ